jgi:hypothetical protein
MIIYKTTNLINGKIYIGYDSKNRSIDDYAGSGKLLNRAIVKYGIDNFNKEILEHVTEENWEEQETYWISKLDATNKEIGYNIAKGGNGGDTFTHHPNKEEISKKRSLANKGRIHTEESRKNMSEGRKGIKFSDETLKKMSNSQKGNKNKAGKKVSEESRKKMSDAKIGKKASKETKQKMSSSQKGKVKSELHKQAISAAKSGITFDDNHKENLRQAWLNREPMSEETKRKMSESRKGKKRGQYKKKTNGNISNF